MWCDRSTFISLAIVIRRDSLYYRLFQQLPSLFFQFVSEAPANTNQYHEEEALKFVLRQLKRRVGKDLPSKVRSQVSQLPLTALERLGEDLLDFTSIADLKAWLGTQQEK